MRRIIFLILILIFSIATVSQTGDRRGGQTAFEIKQSIYFSDGTLDEFLTSRWDSNFNNLEAQERFAASGAKLEWIEYQYNRLGNPTTKITRDVEERLRGRIVYSYNQQELLFRENVMDTRGRIASIVEFDYDNRGNQSKRIIRNREGNILAETTFTFNSQGQLTESQTRDSAGGRAISSTRYFYDSAGNLIRQTVFDAYGVKTSEITSVWQGGNEITNEMKGADGTVLMRITNEFGTNGELLTRKIDNFQGESSQVIRYEYTLRPVRR